MGCRQQDNLQQLQQNFAEALHYRQSPVSKRVTAGRLAPEQRIQIYRNNFIISLSEVLEATYPCCKAVVGDECFAQLARQHVLTRPLKEGNVTDYGDRFVDTISSQTRVIAAVPYIVDLARLEWLVDRASQHVAIASNFPFERLARITEDNFSQLTLEVAEPVYFFDSQYPVASLWQMITSDQVESVDITRSESVIIQHRQEEGMLVIATTPSAIGLMRLCQQGQPLGEADDSMLVLLGELIRQQFFTRIHGLPEGECAD